MLIRGGEIADTGDDLPYPVHQMRNSDAVELRR